MPLPSIYETAFDCPLCGAFAKQDWFRARGEFLRNSYLDALKESLKQTDAESLIPGIENSGIMAGVHVISHITFSVCSHCRRASVWNGNKLILPAPNLAPSPSEDMPPDVLEDYNEAASIFVASSRGAAALLRLALQKLCKHLGEPGKHIDTDIASLVRKGLDVRVQQALDAIRVIGNEAVHPGSIDLRADRESAEMLFQLMNLIVEKMVSEPKHVQSIYNRLPQSKREAIERRDSKQ